MDIHRKAMEVFGDAHQIHRTVEELNELSLIVLKALRTGPGTVEDPREDIIGEVADVLETLNYLYIKYNISEREVDKARLVKRKKLYKYIQESE